MLTFHKLPLYALLTFLSFPAAGALHAAPITITASVTQQGSNFLYDFVINNSSATDPDAELVSVDLPSLPAGFVVGSATAPNGFGAVTDLSYILFDYNNGPSFPLNVATDGFQFVGTTKLASIAFEATYLNSAETQADVFTGAVSPNAVAAVPEPASWIPLLPALLFVASRVRKARR